MLIPIHPYKIEKELVGDIDKLHKKVKKHKRNLYEPDRRSPFATDINDRAMMIMPGRGSIFGPGRPVVAAIAAAGPSVQTVPGTPLKRRFSFGDIPSVISLPITGQQTPAQKGKVAISLDIPSAERKLERLGVEIDVLDHEINELPPLTEKRKKLVGDRDKLYAQARDVQSQITAAKKIQSHSPPKSPLDIPSAERKLAKVDADIDELNRRIDSLDPHSDERKKLIQDRDKLYDQARDIDAQIIEEKEKSAAPLLKQQEELQKSKETKETKETKEITEQKKLSKPLKPKPEIILDLPKAQKTLDELIDERAKLVSDYNAFPPLPSSPRMTRENDAKRKQLSDKVEELDKRIKTLQTEVRKGGRAQEKGAELGLTEALGFKKTHFIMLQNLQEE
jgi:hypothetical protein